MKTFLASVALLVCCAGCYNTNEVVFLYFNLSRNEIVVDSVAGLPPWASPGVLVPVHAEDQLSTSGMSSTGETIRVAPMLKIVWHEAGASHQAEFKRDDLGIPAKFKKGKIRFTYLGGDKWRVTRLK